MLACLITNGADVELAKFNSMLLNTKEDLRMSRICQVTGKGGQSGNSVSHAQNKTRRRWLPNLHDRRIWVASENRWIRLRVSNHGLRIIDKRGIDAVLTEMRARGEKV